MGQLAASGSFQSGKELFEPFLVPNTIKIGIFTYVFAAGHLATSLSIIPPVRSPV